MASGLTKAQLLAQAIAYEEAADHLDLDWTRDPIEREQGKTVSRRLRESARLYRSRAISTT